MGLVTQAKAPGLIASTVNNMMIQHGSTPFFSDSCGDIQITFPQVFDQIPIVLISQREATAGYGDYIVFSVSKTGFSVSKTGSCITAGYVNWIAIGN